MRATWHQVIGIWESSVDGTSIASLLHSDKQTLQWITFFVFFSKYSVEHKASYYPNKNK